MSKVDEFIEANDREANLDTSFTLKSDNSNTETAAEEPSTRSIVVDTPHAVKSFKVQPQVSPASPSNQQHPLRDTPTHSPANAKLGRSNTMKRLSLIQPIISQDSTPKEHRTAQPGHLHRQRSKSIVSGHSRSSSSASEQPVEPKKDVNTLLQQLANKELELLETKHKIEELKKSLHQEETQLRSQTHQLHDLKTQVEVTLNNGIDEHKHGGGLQSLQMYTQPSSNSSLPDAKRTPSKRESVWSKPLTLFNQFDQLIQHELEKKLNWDEYTSPEKAQPMASEQVTPKPADDVLGNVSSSLWNFVSDVRTGLMGINEEPEEEDKVRHTQHRKQDQQQVKSETNQLKFTGKEVELKEFNGKKSS
ncbi:LANO_0F16490g1_1 [Lachancea nothofagi CBS 11611]|uniref:Topoisomerase I damage affected protein 11 n=1 Tax=Lachancea nothofagi CBS 11611 TaxID=1266666 RepID=A0A1G4KD07_9SACH|nr:LANO_0F16490g1_1 [Lachancea nothofagi CBS 11611]